MTVADGMGLQSVFLHWLMVAGNVVADLYLQMFYSKIFYVETEHKNHLT